MESVRDASMPRLSDARIHAGRLKTSALDDSDRTPADGSAGLVNGATLVARRLEIDQGSYNDRAGGAGRGDVQQVAMEF
jgi:hypothetical protein